MKKKYSSCLNVQKFLSFVKIEVNLKDLGHYGAQVPQLMLQN